jgi:hypothetical protein
MNVWDISVDKLLRNEAKKREKSFDKELIESWFIDKEGNPLI